MPRPPNPNPRVKLHISLPPELVARLKLLFFTELSLYGVQKGALSSFIEQAIVEKLERLRPDVPADRGSDSEGA